MYKIAVMGAPDTVLGFKALGLETVAVSDDAEAKYYFRKLVNSDEKYAIIYIEEKLSLALSAEIEAVRERVMPAVILIPGRDGNLGLGQSALRASVIRAVGADILGN
jgi:V/A-type H+-transporting ATPase subunit F